MTAGETFALGLGLGLGGAFFNSPSLLVPGIALIILALAAVLWVRLAARRATLRREGEPVRIFEGATAEAELTARAGLLPVPESTLEAPGNETRSLGRALRGSRRVTTTVRAGRRGRAPLEARWRMHDPLGMAAASVTADGPGAQLLVLPRIEPVMRGGGADPLGVRPGDADPGAGDRHVDAAEAEIDGLRPYREGSPATRIHWPAFARSGEMLERRLVAGRGDMPLIILDALAPVGEEELDRAVRATASLCVYLAHTRTGCRLLLPGLPRPLEIDGEMHAWPAAHEALALVAAGTRTTAIAHRSGDLVLVGAGRREPLAGAIAARGQGRRYVVTASPRPGRAPSFTVAGCAGYRVGRRAATPAVGVAA